MNTIFYKRAGRYGLRSVVFLFVMSLSVSLQSTPPVRSHRMQFIQQVLKQAKSVNNTILDQKKRLDALYEKFLNKPPLSIVELDWLRKLAHDYKVSFNLNDPDTLNNPQTWQTLKKRVDIIPLSLIIAQAIYESDWGRSRFAQKAHNYFGQHCFTTGCGLIPHARGPQEKFEMQRFANMRDSIQRYVRIMNTLKAHTRFRTLRYEQRLMKGALESQVLTSGLSQYAEQPHYEEAIQRLICQQHLQEYDRLSI